MTTSRPAPGVEETAARTRKALRLVNAIVSAGGTADQADAMDLAGWRNAARVASAQVGTTVHEPSPATRRMVVSLLRSAEARAARDAGADPLEGLPR
jgi:hypothetical protein